MKVIVSFTLALIFAFMSGYLANGILAGAGNFYLAQPFSGKPLSIPGIAPSDHVKESQIHVFSNRIVLDLENAAWSSFTPTGSMKPLFDENANGIEIMPKSADEIKVGDVISYISDYASGIVIHRVVEIGTDEDGWYAIVKGDNNPAADPGKVRFEQIEGVLVGLIF